MKPLERGVDLDQLVSLALDQRDLDLVVQAGHGQRLELHRTMLGESLLPRYDAVHAFRQLCALPL
jgi:hypothetical protein